MSRTTPPTSPALRTGRQGGVTRSECPRTRWRRSTGRRRAARPTMHCRSWVGRARRRCRGASWRPTRRPTGPPPPVPPASPSRSWPLWGWLCWVSSWLEGGETRHLMISLRPALPSVHTAYTAWLSPPLDMFAKYCIIRVRMQ